MPRYMVTHSLLSSWLYAIKENPLEDATTERDPMAEFLQVLRREPTATTQAMANGIRFEDMVADVLAGCADANEDWYGAAERVASLCAGGTPQYKVSQTVEVCGMRVLLYGRLDYLKAGGIIDIKFSKGYDRGKYFDSTQHPFYFELVPEAGLFTYIISNGKEVWTEKYRRDEVASIYDVISDFFSWLEAMGYMEIYKEKWAAYERKT